MGHLLATLLALAGSVWSQGAWEIRANYPVAATEVSAAAIDGKVYAVCGLTAAGSVSSLYIYDLATDTWKAGAPVPIPGGGDHCNVAAANGKLYVLGAIRVGSSFVDPNTYEYDPAQDRWTSVGRMTVARGASGVASDGRRIYVAGGLAPNSSVPSFEVFDTTTKTWSVLPPMPTPRDHLTAQFVNGKFYAIAGRNSQDLNTVEEFDPSTTQWRNRAAAPTARGGLGSATVDGRIYVMGGEGNSATPEATFRQNEEYDPAANTWRTMAPMPTPRHGLYGAAIGRAIVTPSGGHIAGANFSNKTELFVPPPSEAPVITGGPVNAASYSSDLAPGMLAVVAGRNLAPATQVNGPRTSMLTTNAGELELLYVTPEQIAFRVPEGIAVGSITVSHGGLVSSAVPFRVQGAAAPGIFSLTMDGKGQGAILVAGTGLIARLTRDAFSRAPRRGEVVEIYCTGFGVPPGQVPVEAEIGGKTADVLYNGLAPGFFGLYQVNARVPSDSAIGGQVEVRLRAAGAVSNVVTMGVVE